MTAFVCVRVIRSNTQAKYAKVWLRHKSSNISISTAVPAGPAIIITPSILFARYPFTPGWRVANVGLMHFFKRHWCRTIKPWIGSVWFGSHHRINKHNSGRGLYSIYILSKRLGGGGGWVCAPRAWIIYACVVNDEDVHKLRHWKLMLNSESNNIAFLVKSKK